MNFEPARNESGERLDVWLERRAGGFSRSAIQSLIRAGHVRVNGRTVKPHLKVSLGMVVSLDPPPPAPCVLEPERIPLEVIHEDGDIIVVNKPANMVVHPAAGNPSGTLVNALLHHCDDLAGIGGCMRPGIVHRLDKDTSGAIVAAKNQFAMESLVRQFKEGAVRKEYLALARGKPTPAAGRVETLIGRSPRDRKKMAAMPSSSGGRGGRYALTEYAVEEAFGDCCLLRVRIHTGRTHQIRVHLSHIGHPVLGDRQYGGGRRAQGLPVECFGRQMLHAELLGFLHPRSGVALEFRARIPGDFAIALKALRERGS